MIRVRALDTLCQMAHGNAAAITPTASEFSTQRAAHLIGISRPHLVKLLERGDLPDREIGSRGVMVADLFTYPGGPPANARSSICSSIPSRQRSKRSPRAKW
jgi:hypothetical protein